MTRDEVLELIQRDLDGDLAPAEQAALRQAMLREPEYQLLYDRLKRVSDQLAQLPPVTPPFSLVDAILPKLKLTDSRAQGSLPDVAGQPVPVLPQLERKQAAVESSARRRLPVWVAKAGSGVVAACLLIGLFLGTTHDRREHPDAPATLGSVPPAAGEPSTPGSPSSSPGGGTSSGAPKKAGNGDGASPAMSDKGRSQSPSGAAEHSGKNPETSGKPPSASVSEANSSQENRNVRQTRPSGKGGTAVPSSYGQSSEKKQGIQPAAKPGNGPKEKGSTGGREKGTGEKAKGYEKEHQRKPQVTIIVPGNNRGSAGIPQGNYIDRRANTTVNVEELIPSLIQQ